jgi:putative endonuclease
VGVAGQRRPTERQRRGASAEALVADHLRGAGWRIVAGNIRLGGVEIDLLAIDPEPPTALVMIEVRSLRTASFGTPEERVDRAKVVRLYRALAALRTEQRLADGTAVPDLPTRVDLIVVDRRPGRHQMRHLRSLEPP